MTRIVIAVALVAAIVLLSQSMYAKYTRDPLETWEHPPPREHTDLADRINHACKPGYTVFDWTTGDEFDPVPEGTVKVTCQEQSPGEDNIYGSYYTAVPR